MDFLWIKKIYIFILFFVSVVAAPSPETKAKVVLSGKSLHNVVLLDNVKIISIPKHHVDHSSHTVT